MKEPHLEDFHLTPERLEDIDFIRSVLKVLFYFLYGVVSLVTGYLIIPFKWCLENIFQIMGSLVIAIIVYLFFSILFSTRHLADSVIRCFFHDYDRYRKFKNKFSRWLRRTNPEYWYQLDDAELAQEVLSIFQERGDTPKIIRTRYDRSTDILLKDKTLLRVKAGKIPVGLSIVRELYSAMEHIQVEKAILITTGGLTSQGEDFIQGKPLEVFGIPELIRLNNEL